MGRFYVVIVPSLSQISDKHLCMAVNFFYVDRCTVRILVLDLLLNSFGQNCVDT